MSNDEEVLFDLDQYEEKAKEMIEDNFIRRYIFEGADFDQGIRRNREALKDILLYPRVCRGLAKKRDLSTKILGHEISLPIGFSPTMCRSWIQHDGELAAAEVAIEMNFPFCLSFVAETPLERVAKCYKRTPNCVKFFGVSLYDEESLREVVDRAEKCNYHGLVVTVDHPCHGNRRFDKEDHEEYKQFSNITMPNLPKKMQEEFKDENASYDQSPPETFEDLAMLKKMTKLPVIAKGILRPEDALACVKAGIDAVWVSNHGGRQLGDCPATVELLQDIAPVLKGSGVELYIDGGFRHGADVLKALAIGANCVFVGRPVLSGLAVNGKDGIEESMKLMRKELDIAMALCGCNSISDIDSSVLWSK
ncbi:DgyrCDS1984 [Dimorphilus gyrociliatus]|uniref:DgyrCDS1984 n=1 Tax=Dimorphilus gyrociliatus TaxID=2664684 RepID=A0A7I8VAA0_9ANNE|nr:DgyrCDS1984 [Dimorphilus gyrociliatus]